MWSETDDGLPHKSETFFQGTLWKMASIAHKPSRNCQLEFCSKIFSYLQMFTHFKSSKHLISRSPELLFFNGSTTPSSGVPLTSNVFTRYAWISTWDMTSWKRTGKVSAASSSSFKLQWTRVSSCRMKKTKQWMKIHNESLAEALSLVAFKTDQVKHQGELRSAASLQWECRFTS